MNYFTSDLHIGGIDFVDREFLPFSSSTVYENNILECFSKLSKTDTLYIIGDLVNYNKIDKTSWTETLPAFGKSLKCFVYLIMGNGEERLIKEKFGDDFDKFLNYCNIIFPNGIKIVHDLTLNIGGINYLLIHRPSEHRDNYTLFGHTHRTTGTWKPYGINCGYMIHYFKPLSENDVIKYQKLKDEWWDNDTDNNCVI